MKTSQLYDLTSLQGLHAALEAEKNATNAGFFYTLFLLMNIKRHYGHKCILFVLSCTTSGNILNSALINFCVGLIFSNCIFVINKCLIYSHHRLVVFLFPLTVSQKIYNTVKVIFAKFKPTASVSF